MVCLTDSRRSQVTTKSMPEAITKWGNGTYWILCVLFVWVVSSFIICTLSTQTEARSNINKSGPCIAEITRTTASMSIIPTDGLSPSGTENESYPHFTHADRGGFLCASATGTYLLQTEAQDDVYKVVNLKQSGAFDEFHPQRFRPVRTESLRILRFSESSHCQ